MCGLGTSELLIVLAIVLLLFGAAKLPQLGKALGETVRSFKKGQAGPGAINESDRPEALQDRAEVARLEEREASGSTRSRVEDAELVDSNGDKNKPA